jgi:AraC-like DNA-binding protein
MNNKPITYSFGDKSKLSFSEYYTKLNQSDNFFNSYKRWTLTEDLELHDLSKNLSIEDLSSHFKRIEGGIRYRLRKIKGMSKKDIKNKLHYHRNSNEIWTEKEDIELLVDMRYMTLDELVKKFGRSEHSLCQRVYHLEKKELCNRVTTPDMETIDLYRDYVGNLDKRRNLNLRN